MPLSHAMKLIAHGLEEEKRAQYYQWWLARYPMYTKDDYESFDEFYEKVQPKPISLDQRPKDEIMAELLGQDFEERG